MSDVLGGVVSAGGDLLSSVVSGLFGNHSAKKQMEYQTRMSNTAYQRAAKDLEKAGLNRILALGNPASTPTGASATMPDSKMGSSYQSGASASSARKMNEASIALLQQQQAKAAEETKVASAQVANVNADTALKTGTTANLPLIGNEIKQRTLTYPPNIKMTTANTRMFEELARLHGTEADKNQWLNKKAIALNPFIDLLIERVLTPLSNSAKDTLDGKNDIPKIFAPGGLHVLKKMLGIP